MTVTASSTWSTQVNPISGDAAYDLLLATGHSVFLGVPCSLLEPLHRAIRMDSERVRYLAATREDLALGVASGLALGGERPAVLMQNSGLYGSIGALLSLPKLYRLGMTLIVSWRGYGLDKPEHVETGARMQDLLDLIDLPTGLLVGDKATVHQITSQDTPSILLVRPGDLGV
jgi:sulfopyruvate decarboxylase subunit alpha